MGAVKEHTGATIQEINELRIKRSDFSKRAKSATELLNIAIQLPEWAEGMQLWNYLQAHTTVACRRQVLAKWELIRELLEAQGHYVPDSRSKMRTIDVQTRIAIHELMMTNKHQLNKMEREGYGTIQTNDY